MRSILLLLWIHGYFLLNFGFSQTSSFPAPLTQTPEAYAFTKHGNISGGMYSGTINQSIPLYTIKYHGFEFPILMSTGGQAAKVDEFSSWVGLNWTLVTNCYIDEVKLGIDDASSYSHVYKPLYESLIHTPGGIYQFYPRTIMRPFEPTAPPTATHPYIYMWQPAERFELGYYEYIKYGLEDLSNGKLFMPDLFHFNVLDYSGSFYVDPISDEVKLYNGDPKLRIRRLTNGSGGWEITLPNGTLFEFRIYDTSENYDIDYTHTSRKTWKITKIILDNNKAINFRYDSKSYLFKKYINNGSISFRNDSDNGKNFNHNGQLLPPIEGGFSLPMPESSIDYLQTCQNSELYLKEIQFGTNKILFNISSDPKPLLLELQVVDGLSNTITHHWSLNYGEFNKYNQSFWNEPEASRQVYNKKKLISLQNKTDGQIYRFEYYENIGIPHVFSKSRDYWGMFNGETNQKLLVNQLNIFPIDTIKYYQFTNSAKLQIAADYTAIRTFDSSYAIQGMLKKIIYPTGGYTEFKYEPHRFVYQGGYIRNKAEFLAQAGDGMESIGAGFRVKYIEDYNTNDILVARKEYQYAPLSGILHKPLNFLHLLTKATYASGFYHTAKPSIDSSYPSVTNSADVGYSKVTEVAHDINSGMKSKKVITYHNYHFVHFGDDDFTFAYYNDYRNGLVESEKYFKNDSILLKSVRNEYQIVKDTIFNAFSAKKEMDHEPSGYATFKVFNLPIITEMWKNSVRLDTLFEGSGYIANKSNISYTTDRFKNIKEERIFTSDRILKKTHYYPNEMPSAVNNEMVLNNIVSTPVKSVWNYEDKPTQNIYVENTAFKKWHSKFFKPEKIEVSGKGNYTNLITHYDIYGNPLEIKEKDNSTTVFLWGYGGQYPVAEIKNAAYSEVLSVLGQSTLDKFNDSTTTELFLIESASLLRNHLSMKKAQVISYTYFPLVGMASKTDYRGYSEYYKYDDAGRLSLIVDHENNIIKTFCYNYKGEKIDCNLYHNDAFSRYFTKNDCSTGTVGSGVTYLVPAGRHVSSKSKADADQKALEDINRNGQAYANANGNCIALPPNTSFDIQRPIDSAATITQIVFHSANSAVGSFTIYPDNNGTYLSYSIPSGIYNSIQFYVVPIFGTNNYLKLTTSSGSQSRPVGTAPNTITFDNVNIVINGTNRLNIE